LASVTLNDADFVNVLAIGDLRRNTVSIAGAVFQPGEFEYTPGMTLDSLVKRAQGTLPSALTDRVKLRRQIPATGRSESYSLDLSNAADRAFSLGEFDAVAVLDGRVAFPSGTLSVTGAVRRPFDGPFVEHARLRDVIDLAGGFTEYALTDRIKIERPVFEKGRTELFSVDFRTDSGAAFALSRDDRISVLDARTAFPARIISVVGAVVTSGERAFVEHESLRDAIDRSGGLTEDASFVEVARRKYGPEFNDTTSTFFRFDVNQSNRTLASKAAVFILEPDDRIQVRGSPGFRSQRLVGVSGMFAQPGEYAIIENRERVSDVVRRAGGTLPGAYVGSFHLTRGGKVVGVDFQRALRGERFHDVLLLSGDQLSIGPDTRTVFVTGEVSRPSLLTYRPGLSVDDYIELAGGPTEKGLKHKAVVDYQSGFSKRVRRYLGFIKVEPEVASGAVITVPARPENKGTSGELWARVLATSTALTSMIIALVAVRKL
jgi:polysaccharide export outer membrane protein